MSPDQTEGPSRGLPGTAQRPGTPERTSAAVLEGPLAPPGEATGPVGQSLEVQSWFQLFP